MPRRDGIPTIVNADNSVQRLERLSLGEKVFSEDWLQQKLLELPTLLPVEEIDPSFGPLVPIGREISTQAGPIDNLYISPQGFLTLVEAKLWRNPEARREVIGQMLDYAKELSSWSYDELNRRSQTATGHSLWKLVAGESDKLSDESRFIDSVIRNLKDGRFLLLLAGDGIREEMERLAEYLQQASRLRFTLALVELQIFRCDHDRLLILPLVVARTQEITRAVVRVESTANAQVSVAIELPPDEPSRANRSTLTPTEFFNLLGNGEGGDLRVDAARRLIDDFESDPRFLVDWGVSSLILKLRDPVQPQHLFTILVVPTNGKTYIGWLDSQLPKVGLPLKLGETFASESAMALGRQPHATLRTTWDRNVPLEMIAANYDALRRSIMDFASAIHANRKSQDEI